MTVVLHSDYYVRIQNFESLQILIYTNLQDMPLTEKKKGQRAHLCKRACVRMYFWGSGDARDRRRLITVSAFEAFLICMRGHNCVHTDHLLAKRTSTR